MKTSFVALFLLLIVPVNAIGADFTVNTTTDSVDTNPGDGVCADAGNDCSLRAAVMEANALPGTDNIGVPAGVHRLSLTGASEDGATTGDLDITESVAITGAGRKTTFVNGLGADRILHVIGNTTALTVSEITLHYGRVLGGGGNILNQNNGNINLSNCIVSRGMTDGSNNGGGILNLGDGIVNIDNCIISENYSNLHGGGIHNDGTVPGTTHIVIRNSSVDRNIAKITGGGIANSDSGDIEVTDSTVSGNATEGFGGGIYNDSSGDISLTRSTISGNTAGIDGTGDGGGLFLNAGATVTITDSTFSFNYAPRSGAFENAGDGVTNILRSTFYGNVSVTHGGAITQSDAGGTTVVKNSTVNANVSDQGGGGIEVTNGVGTINNSTITSNFSGNTNGGGLRHVAGTLTISNSIVSYNNPDNCTGTIASGGNNIDDDGNCFAAGDFPNTDPRLLPLADNGGRTLTQLPFSGSPAIDSGNNVSCESTDQREITRPVDGDENNSAICDIGAVEFITDCNENNVPDEADITDGTENDCNTNLIPDSCETDGDSDGTIDSCDLCPDDPNKIALGDCGCGAADTDANDNGVSDCLINAEFKALIAEQRSDLGDLKRKSGKDDKQDIRDQSDDIVSYISSFTGQIDLEDADANLSQLGRAAQKRSKKAVKTKSRRFKRNKKRAIKAVNTLDDAVADQ